MAEEQFAGGCFCGAVRFSMRSRPMFIHACHCRDCRRQSGGPFVINGLIETDRITVLKGAPACRTLATDSGHPHDLSFCADCGTALWSDYGRRGWMLFVRMATLDAPESFVPDVHIYTATKLPWLPLPAGARSFSHYYDMNAEWPAESTERRRAARSRAAAGRQGNG
ncbi:GFA family protein [uncultured Martelella sp.]|uniref:GFA family protein n=1 Tax=uncultured Martelella sp. TaxID=392331 RepID=UPI0029C968C2|nr:GFA family protein [uncultured Martelella sp.]